MARVALWIILIGGAGILGQAITWVGHDLLGYAWYCVLPVCVAAGAGWALLVPRWWDSYWRRRVSS